MYTLAVLETSTGAPLRIGIIHQGMVGAPDDGIYVFSTFDEEVYLSTSKVIALRHSRSPKVIEGADEVWDLSDSE
mgnify:CR=1 FL=1|jgi:hypothetical protein